MLKNLVLVAVTLVVCLLLLEAGLRIAGISYPAFYQEDPYLGSTLRPGAEGRFRAEGGSWVHINRDGMRDRDHAVPKPAGTFRIAVLGDSFAEAMPVAADKAFWAVMERELAKCAPGRTVEAMNFGVSGYGTAQELLMLRRKVWKYQPDIVLLAFFSGNDVRNNSSPLNNDPVTPYFVLRDGRLVLDEGYRDSLRSLKLSPRALAFSNVMAGVRNHSRLLQMVSEARTAIARRSTVKAADNMASAENAAAKGGELGIDDAVYSEPATQAWKDAWQVTERLIAQMRDEVRSHGAGFWVATLSTGIQVHPDAGVRNAFMRRLGISSLFYPDMRVRAFCEREGIPVITLAPELAAWAEAHHEYLHGFRNAAMGFGHWNETGNRVAGERIAARLCDAVRGASHPAP